MKLKKKATSQRRMSWTEKTEELGEVLWGMLTMLIQLF